MPVSRSVLARGLALMALAGLTLPALADTTVSDAWVRATVPHQPSTGAFMTLTASTDSTLVSVASPVASDVQVHEMSMKGDVMGMRKVDALPLPAGKAVSLDPEGYHVMLMGLNTQVKEGTEVPLTLTVEDDKGERQVIEIKAPVRPLTASADHGHAMH